MNRYERAERAATQAAWDAQNLRVRFACDAQRVPFLGGDTTQLTATRDAWRDLTYYLISSLDLWSELAPRATDGDLSL